MPQRKLYSPGQTALYKLSRSQLELFVGCRRCFWLLHRQGIKKPGLPGFLLNSAVDLLFKKEFDTYRKKAEPHPLMTAFGIKAIPYDDKELDTWRNPFEGIKYTDTKHQFLLYGGVDDIWINPQKELIVVDYKSTAKDKEASELLDPPGGYHDAYRRQLEIYQWLFAKSGHQVCPTAYFVYTNGQLGARKFGDKLSFKTAVIAHEGQTGWIDKLIPEIKACLEGELPVPGKACEYCQYTKQRLALTFDFLKNQKAG